MRHFLVAGALLLAACGSDDTPTGRIGPGPGCSFAQNFSFASMINGPTLTIFVSLNVEIGSWRSTWVTDVQGVRLLVVEPIQGQQPMGQPQFGNGAAIVFELPTDGGVPAELQGSFVMHNMLQNGTSSCDLTFPVAFTVADGMTVTNIEEGLPQ